jgi:TonB-dependent starch-binding outer membrane protein SusC
MLTKMKKDNCKQFIPFLCLLVILLSGFSAYSQNLRTITGTVTDDTGSSLPGATVKLRNGTTSTQTNENGIFSIRVPEGSSVLVVSYLGMQSKEVNIGNDSNLKITLSADANNTLNEVVVIGYGTARRAEITSSISSVSEKDLKNLPVANLDQAIQGKVSGVTVQTNGGQPGGGISVLVRGVTSVNGNEPLYVVDGVPLSGSPSANYNGGGAGAAQTVQSPLSNINPADIASIDILKDASAQAIYGSRAANGVVIVTTKKGRAGESKVTYDVFRGRSEVQTKLDMMNLSQYAQFSNEVFEEIATTNGNPYIPIGEYKDPSVLGNGSDWQEAIFRTGITDQHQLSFSGGSNKTSYYTSAGYYNQEGVVVGSGVKRYSMRVNLDQQVKDWFKLGINSTFSRANQQVALTNGSATPISVAVSNSPAAPIYYNGTFAPSVNIGGYNFGTNQNPLALASLRDVSVINNRALANLYGEISFLKHFSLRSQFGVDYSGNQNTFFEPEAKNGNSAIIPVSSISEQRGNGLFWNLTNLFNYNQNFGKHGVTAQLGQEAWESTWDNISGYRRNLVLNFKSIAAGSRDLTMSADGGSGESAMYSYFARAGYTFADKYSLNLSARRDGSSSFGPEKRFGNFAAASVGWTVTNESFAEDLKYLDYLKLRLGAGAVGNANTRYSNAFTSRMTLQTGAFGQGSWPYNVPNPFVGWEAVKTYNAGVDATILNKRLEVTFEVYRKVTTDMLLQSSLPGYTGIGSAWDDIQAPITNAGKMVNKGYDVTVNSFNFTKKNFKWRTTLIFSHYTNALKELNVGNVPIISEVTDALNAPRKATITQINAPVGQFYGYVADGVFKSEDEISNHANQGIAVGPKGTWLGDVKYRDISGPEGSPDGQIDSYDITTIGNPNPKFTFGLTNSFNIGALDVSVFLQGRQGGDILNFTKLLTEGLYNVYNNQTVDALENRFSAKNPNGALPRYNSWHENNRALSSRFVEDGSYLRIQTVSLGFNLPSKYMSKVKISNARIFVLGQNLYTFTKYSGLDPELGSFNNNILMSNIDNGNYPNPRTYTLGANITF